MTQDEVKDLLHYDPITGIFTNKIRRSGACAGKKAGSLNNKGYALIWINKKNYAAHRLAWFYVYGVWPTFEIDHINMVRHDNRICNLRSVSRQENQHNKKSTKGYHYVEKSNKWTAAITLNTKRIYLGTYDSESDAHQAYLDAKKIYHKL